MIKRISLLGVLLSISALLFPYGAGRATLNFDLNDPPALVQIDLKDETELSAFAALDLPIYTHIYHKDGGITLLLPADKIQQTELVRQGYTLRVLDADASGANYHLLYSLPDNLRLAGADGNILLVEEQQAVARLTPEQVIHTSKLDIKTVPLRLHRLSTRPLKTYPRLPSTLTTSGFVQEMIAQVASNKLFNYVGGLSGEWPVTIDGSPFTLTTRYTYTTLEIKNATRFSRDHFQSLGLENGYDYYSIGGYQKRNVLAQQVGLTEPNRILLLTAHLDSTSYVNGNPYSLAPGADDNASGSAGLMHIAEILSGYNFGCTLRYALFTGEEQGMYGSRAYAADLASQRENIEAVLNLDMIAYNTAGSSPVIELHTRPGNPGDLSIANLFANVVSSYQINLVPRVLQDGLSFSDHTAFWERGYPAILAIEDWSDHTPHYHRTSDQLETLNMGYYTEFVKAALATFAHMGCLLEGRISGTVHNAATADPLPAASVDAWLNGQVVASATSGVDGRYQLDLIPGNYSVVVSTTDYLIETFEDIQVAQGQTSPLNASLQPCTWVKDANIAFSPYWPEVGETITFTGTVGSGETPITYAWNFGDGDVGDGQVITHTYSAKGGYPVRLTTNNACSVPSTASALAPVEVEMYYLPLVLYQVQP